MMTPHLFNRHAVLDADNGQTRQDPLQAAESRRQGSIARRKVAYRPQTLQHSYLLGEHCSSHTD